MGKSLHDGTISQDNEGHIIAEGLIVQKFEIPNDSDHILKINIDYVADKDGYRTKYVLVKEEFVARERVSVATLKSVAG